MLFGTATFMCAQKEVSRFEIKADTETVPDRVFLKTNILPWLATIPNISAEYTFHQRWSANVDLWFCPWKLSDRFSIKTAAIFPEGRFWLKNNHKGHFFNVHFSAVWFNARIGNYRYQDDGRVLLGGGIGYGYRLFLSEKWGLEFTLGAGVASARYDRYFNVANGALKDARSTFYIGIDRLGVSVVYNLGDI